MDNGNMPVNPVKGANDTLLTANDLGYIEQCKPFIGLSKREHFAAMAMQGLLSNSTIHSWSDDQYYNQISKQAVTHADALLKELAK